MEELQLISRQHPGEVVIDNFLEMKDALAQVLARYENVVYTEDMLSDAKADKKELTRLRKEIDDRRKEVKKAYLAPYNEFEAQALELRELCGRYGVPLILNDDAELAQAAGADGVHVGQSDMEAGRVRALLGEDKLIGVSARTVEQALAAQAAGADYLGVGAMFPTGTKQDTRPVSYDTLKAICAAVDIPVVAIGGIGAGNVAELAGSGIAGVAVVSALYAQPDVEAATRSLRAQVERVVGP